MTLINEYLKPALRPLYNPLFDAWHRFRVDHFTKQVLEENWLAFAGKAINWDNPQTLNEKIQWLMAFTDTSEWTRLADKVLVRDYVREKGLGDILIPLVGTWQDARDIDFEALPDKCVLKCNHDSGSVVIFDKSSYSESVIIEKLNKCLRQKYGYLGCEPHYNKIKPCILCEEFVDLDTAGLSSSPIDYKVFCYNGEPDLINVYYNRTEKNVTVEAWDTDWNHHPEFQGEGSHYQIGQGLIPRPTTLDRMLEAARILSEGLPQVRVDFYESHGALYFGEMTMTSRGGRMVTLSDKYQKRAGALVDLSLAKRK